MRFRVERDTLAESVAWAARALPPRPALPVLAGLRLSVAGHQLTISGFDYEVSSQVEVEVTAEEAGEVLVPGRLLADICRSLPGQPVQVATEGAQVEVVCGSSRFRLATLPLDEYPALPDMPAVSGSIGADSFATAVSSVAVAAGRDDTLPVLTGVLMDVRGDQLTLAATDRYRLAVRRLTWQPEDPTMAATALVPARTLSETARTLTSGAHVSVALAVGGIGEGMAGFANGGRRTTTRLLDGEFPKYESLLPEGSGQVARLDATGFADAVKRVALVATRTAPIRLTFSPDGLLLEAGGADDAQASEALPAEFVGEPLTIAFNPTYLLDGLGALDSDTVEMSFTVPTRPVLLTGKPEGEAGGADQYQYLLMPVRLSG